MDRGDEGTMAHSEVAGEFGLRPVTVNRIALRAGQRRGSCGRDSL